MPTINKRHYNDRLLRPLIVTLGYDKYCRFMSHPGFKVWDIAKNAKTEEMINTDDYIPFEEYHFKETNVIEAEIILSHLLNEVLNVESRYYAFKLRNEVCN